MKKNLFIGFWLSILAMGFSQQKHENIPSLIEVGYGYLQDNIKGRVPYVNYLEFGERKWLASGTNEGRILTVLDKSYKDVYVGGNFKGQNYTMFDEQYTGTSTSNLVGVLYHITKDQRLLDSKYYYSPSGKCSVINIQKSGTGTLVIVHVSANATEDGVPIPGTNTGSDVYTYVYQLNAKGEKVWDAVLDIQTLKGVYQSNAYFLSGFKFTENGRYPVLIQLNSQGKLVWEKVMGTQSNVTQFRSTRLEVDADKNVVVAFVKQENSENKLVACKIDAFGTVLWEQELLRKTTNEGLNLADLDLRDIYIDESGLVVVGLVLKKSVYLSQIDTFLTADGSRSILLLGMNHEGAYSFHQHFKGEGQADKPPFVILTSFSKNFDPNKKLILNGCYRGPAKIGNTTYLNYNGETHTFVHQLDNTFLTPAVNATLATDTYTAATEVTNHLRITPNPAEAQAIQTYIPMPDKQEYELAIYNYEGAVLYTSTQVSNTVGGEELKKLSLKLAQGIYIVKVAYGTKKLTEKLIIQ